MVTVGGASRLAVRVVAAAALACALWPSAAQADRRVVTLRYGPVAMGGFNVEFPKVNVRSPRLDGYIVGMSARLVDRRHRVVTIRDVMLHHVVFFRRGQRSDSPCGRRQQETFYGTGEENQRLVLPAGYGYRIGRDDRWGMHAMLMSHSSRAMRVYIEYRVVIVTGRRLQGVRPFWVRASRCGLTYPIWGGGGAGATDIQTHAWRIPMDGRIVAVGGHLHGGSKDMWLSQPRCSDRRLLDTAPRYGMPDDLYYRARPVLHEPGPVETRYFLSRTGIAVRRGESLDLSAAYDAVDPHPRVMAIMHVYIAPGKVPAHGCTPLPRDRREIVRRRRVRTDPPRVRIPLNGLDARGHSYAITTPPWPVRPVRSGTTIHLRDFRFDQPHVQISAGDSLVWSFDDAARHNLTYANGPRLLVSHTLSHGADYATRLDVPGHYEFFCYLHPMTMHEVVEVTGDS